MAITLDPKEVKAHLHKLGYSNITPEQLKEFIKDLKKLIKYDQKLLCTCKDSNKANGSSYIDTTPETLRTSNSTSSYSAVENIIPERPRSSRCSNKNYLKTSSSADDRSSQICDSCSIDVPDADIKTKKPMQIPKQKESQKTRSVENLRENTKPKSSFIKPWNINCGLQPGSVKRCDPVLLYKHYQDIWKQQKVPGENSHSDLRWCIREQMLGTDPHPRESSPFPDGMENGCMRRCYKNFCCSCCSCCHRRRKIPVSQASSIGTRWRRKV